jgi:lysyl-tRNA synthetase class 2
MSDKLESGIARDQAYALLIEYNKDPYHIKHGEQLEALMRYYAERYDPANVDFWGQVGLLHDLDWEKWPDAQLHTMKTAEILADAGADPALAKSIQTHNSDMNDQLPKPELQMEKVLFAIDELSGLINACVILRPSHSVADMSVKSLKKKFKTKSFAAGCDRGVIRKGAELMGMDLDELFADILEAEKTLVGSYGCFA